MMPRFEWSEFLAALMDERALPLILIAVGFIAVAKAASYGRNK